MGNQTTKHSGKPRKAVHWKSAEPPSPPGKPMLVPGTPNSTAPDVVTLRWKRPTSDGGSPILGYIIEHRRTGSPHWVRATAVLVQATELSFSGLEPGWRYQFRVVAQNIVGLSDVSELSDALTVTLQRAAVSPPRFVHELFDTTAVENEKIEFRVAVAGTPAPQIGWFKDGFEIFSSRRTKIFSEGDVSVLVIHQAALTDEGEIKCTATNRAGHTATRCNLSIDAYPKIRLPRQYEDGLIIEADEVIRLKIGIAGQPPPIVEWSQNGELLTTGGRFEIETTDKNSSLRISNAQRFDRGEYNLRAYNKLGEDYASFLVTVTARPEPPGKINISMSLGKTVTLSWAAPEDDGGCKIGNYIVEYYRVGWDVWLKASTCRTLSTTLSGLFEGSQYRFRVKAENPYGLSDPSEESDTLFIPDPKRGINSATQMPEVEDLENESQPLSVPRKRREESHSPAREAEQVKKAKAFIPETYSRDEIVREMSYGARDEDFFKPKQPEPRKERSPVPAPPSVIVTEPLEPIPEVVPPSPPMQRPQSFASPLNAMERFSKDPSPLNARASSDSQLAPNRPGTLSSPTSPASTDKSTIHNSSEFMLVLYNEQEAKNNTPNHNKTTNIPFRSLLYSHLYREKYFIRRLLQVASNRPASIRPIRSISIGSGNSTFDFDLDEMVAPPPPLSLSAPELNVEPPPAPMMRAAVSSTELLYERAMARFYQAVAMEETENQRKEAERKQGDHFVEQQLLHPQQNGGGQDASAVSRLADRRSSLRRRLSGDKETIVKQSSFETDGRQHSSALDEVIPEEKEEVIAEENVTMAEKEQFVEEMKLDIKADQLGVDEFDEEASITSSMDSMLEELRRRESARSSRSRLMVSDDEMDTYHPGQRVMSPYRNPDPSQAIEVLTKPLPMPDPNFVPKPILKRPSTEILTKDEKEKKLAPSKPERRSISNIFDRKSPTKDGQQSPRKSLTNIFDRKSPSKDDQQPRPEPVKTPELVKTSEQVNIVEQVKAVEQGKTPEQVMTPEIEASNSDVSDALIEKHPPTELEIKLAIASEASRQKKLESRQSSIEESRAVADFYGEIVQQVESSKKPRKLPLYMTPDEVRKLNQQERSRETSFDRFARSRSGSASPLPVEDIYRIPKSRSPSLASEHLMIKGKPARESKILRQRSASTETDPGRPPSVAKEQPPLVKAVVRPETAFSPSVVSDESTRRSRPMRESTAIAKKRNVSKTRSRSNSAIRDGDVAPDGTPLTTVARRAKLRSASKSPSALQRTPIIQPSTEPQTPPKPTPPAPTPAPAVTPTPAAPQVQPTPEQRSRSHSKTREPTPEEERSLKSFLSYLTDVVLFGLACWLYLFKNPKLAIPVIALIMYRHISEALRDRIPLWMKRTVS